VIEQAPKANAMTSTTLARSVRCARDVSKRKDALLIERGIGYWITNDGEVLAINPGATHADYVRQWFDETPLTGDEKEQLARDANAFALSRGWSRVRVYITERVVYVDFGAGHRASHMRLLDTLYDKAGFAGFQLKYTDEDGNYVDARPS
jgi:hypothetical protein